MSKHILAFFMFLNLFLFLTLTVALEAFAIGADAGNECTQLLSTRVNQLSDKGLVINQNAAGLELADTACGPVCVTDLVQIILELKGRAAIENPVQETNELNALRVAHPSEGTTFEETLAMLKLLMGKYLSMDFLTDSALLDLPNDEGDETISRVKVINHSHLISLNSGSPFEDFNIISFSSFYQGSLRGGHVILLLGRDPKTGHAIIMDPRIGKTALVSMHEEDLMGRSTLRLKFEGSESNSPYWRAYEDYGKLFLTGFIAVRLKN